MKRLIIRHALRASRKNTDEFVECVYVMRKLSLQILNAYI